MIIHWLKIQHLEPAFLGYAFVSILSCNLNNKLKFMQIISVHFLIIKQINKYNKSYFKKIYSILTLCYKHSRSPFIFNIFQLSFLHGNKGCMSPSYSTENKTIIFRCSLNFQSLNIIGYFSVISSLNSESFWPLPSQILAPVYIIHWKPIHCLDCKFFIR